MSICSPGRAADAEACFGGMAAGYYGGDGVGGGQGGCEDRDGGKGAMK